MMDSSSSGQVTKAATLRSRTFCGAMLFVAGENLTNQTREYHGSDQLQALRMHSSVQGTASGSNEVTTSTSTRRKSKTPLHRHPSCSLGAIL